MGWQMWIHYRRLVWRVRYLKEQPALVAKALQRLNRQAKLGGSADRIYALKQRVLKYWYQQGLCTGVVMKQQVLYCRECGGHGYLDYADDYDEGQCRHCDGTGIYRQHTLYEMTFNVDGRMLTFHQPASQVDYLTTPSTISDQLFEEHGRQGRSMSHKFAELCYVLVEQSLPRQMRPAPPVSLHQVFEAWIRCTRIYRLTKRLLQPKSKIVHAEDIPF